ncbi:MAG TPA: type IV pilus secretin PilQ [Rhodanobacteraceae bacterium]
MAANTLQTVSSATLPDGRAQLTLTFSGPASAPQAFSTNTPPRIAMDFANTTNGLAQRSYSVSKGAAQSVSAVEADGRTRVVVALNQPAQYATRVEGDQVIVTIGDSTAHVTTAAASALAPVPPPPMSQSAAAVAAADPAKSVQLANGGNTITSVDFQRSEHGAGKLVIDFSQGGATASMHSSGDTTTIDVSGANLAASQARRLDVTSYATPARSVNTHAVPGGAQVVVNTLGAVRTSSYQTGNQYVVEFQPPKAEGGSLLGAPPPKVYKGSRVTFNFQDIPVRSVLQLLADVSNLNIVASDSVQGNVTLRLVNVPWDQALDVILRAKSLAKRQNGNVIWIAPQTEIARYEQNAEEARQKELNNSPLVTDYIPINYGNAQQIAQLLTSGAKSGNGGTGAGGDRGFLSPRGSVSFDTRTNTLLVNDTPQKVEEIRQLVAVLDRPVKEVLIESRLVVATDNFTRELGAKFGIEGFQNNPSGQRITTGSTVSDVAALNNSATAQQNVAIQNKFNSTPVALGGGLLPGATAPAPSILPGISFPGGLNVNMPVGTAGASSFAIGILGNDYLLNLELSAAQQEGRSETISQPKVVTSNNQEARIQQGQQIGYLTFSAVGGAGGGLQGNVQFKNVVLELDVTPTITSDNRVFMKLKVINDSLAAMIQNPGGGFVPQINHSEVDTSVLVDNGQTVVLGGVYTFTNEHDVTKVPFLGDIPILGALFRDKKNINNKAELLVFITPHILGQETTIN